MYVVMDEPREEGSGIVVTVDLERDAAVIDKHRANYPRQPYSVGDIRSGKDDLWLLSGGTLITDHQGRIAIGLRDGNATNPFAFTNIGAGRCDRSLQEHCMEEFHSELIVCVEDPEGWVQMKFHESAPDLSSVRQRRPAIGKWKAHIGQPAPIVMPMPPLRKGVGGTTTVTVAG